MQPGTRSTMYRFVEYTTGRYMSQEVITVALSTTLRELGSSLSAMTSTRFRWWRPEQCSGS